MGAEIKAERVRWFEGADRTILPVDMLAQLDAHVERPGVGVTIVDATLEIVAMDSVAFNVLRRLELGDDTDARMASRAPALARYIVDGAGEPVAPEQRPAAVAIATREPQFKKTSGFLRVAQTGEVTIVWCRVDAHPIVQGDRAVGAVVLLEDLTDAPEAAGLTLQALTKLSEVAQHAADLIVRRTTTGLITFATGDSFGLTGYRPSDLVGRRLVELVHPDDLERSHEAPTGDGEWSRPYRLVRRDGSIVWVETRASERPDRPGHLIEITRDITTQVLALQELRASEERMRFVIENVSDLVARASPSSQIEWVSSAASGAFGWRPDQLVGRHVHELLHPDDVAVRNELVDRATTGVDSETEMRILCADGTYRWVHVVVRPVFDGQGVVTARIGILRDIDAEHSSRQARRDLEARYLLLAGHTTDVVWQADHDGTCTWVSPSAASVLGWDVDEWIGIKFRSRWHPDDADLHPRLSQRLDQAGTSKVLVRIMAKDGSWRWMSTVSAVAERDADGNVVRSVIGGRDVHDEVMVRVALVASEQMFRSTMMQAPNPIALSSPESRFIAVNEAMCSMLQRDEQWLIGRDVREVIHPDDLADADGAVRDLIDGNLRTSVTSRRYVRADGATIWTTRSLSLIRDRDGQPSYFVAQLDDITDARDARERLAYLAHHDELTGLHNRAWILDLIERSLGDLASGAGRVGVLFIDLDHFKVVNDSLGHAAGDEVLRVIAARLAGPLGACHHLGRLGGDEFVVVVPDACSHVELERLAADISTAVSVDLVVLGHRIVPYASIGIALASAGATAASVLRDADVALYRAKHAGRARWQVFDDAMHERALRRLTVEDDLRRGLEHDELVVHLQPIVRLSDESVAGFEALVRWQHPTDGLLAPGAFLSVAEESGLVAPLGRRVLEQVCAILGAHPALPGRISVNVSAVQLSRADWLSTFADTLQRYGTDPNRLIIEVTETAVLALRDSVRADLIALRRLGVGIHIDDFGTGYSSISLLRELPVTGLKLDRSFVADLTDGESSANALAAGLIGLAAGLGLQSVAEGIETRAQATLLRAQGWRYGQGYLFGRPAGIEAWTGTST